MRDYKTIKRLGCCTLLFLLCNCRNQIRSNNIELAGSIEMVRIPATRFVPGSREDTHSLPSQPHSLPSFLMSATEITARQFCKYLNAADKHNTATFPALICMSGEWTAPANLADSPMTSVTFNEAEQYCRWLSKETGRSVRLPTELEWEAAARGGLHQAPYTWGWGSPEDRAVWNTECSVRTKRFPPNAFGLYEMCGNVYEWCLPSSKLPAGKNVARGGAWPEKDPRFLSVYKRTFMDKDYRGADTGFRIVVP